MRPMSKPARVNVVEDRAECGLPHHLSHGVRFVADDRWQGDVIYKTRKETREHQSENVTKRRPSEQASKQVGEETWRCLRMHS
jgi:hypothetical protein